MADPALRTNHFIANEIASLSIGEIVKLTAAELKLDYKDVSEALKVEAIPGTDMARITATSDQPGQAKAIVDKVIVIYLNTRKGIEVTQAQRTLDALDGELIAQSDLVQNYRKDLTILIQQYGIPFFEDVQNPLGETELEMFTASRKRLLELQIESALLKAELRALEENKTEGEKLLTQIEILEYQIDALSEIITDRQNDTVDLSLKQHTYTQAKETYLQSRDMLREMKDRQQEAHVALKMPRPSLIVRQQAE
ncbi:MAG: hypothetical protein ACJAQT_005024 [Akkermansiaceae bacterium]|jgi:hypothetical protein